MFIKAIPPKNQPEYFHFPSKDCHLMMQYVCGEWLNSDSNFAPLHCLNCGSPWMKFHVEAENPHLVVEKIKGGWNPPYVRD